MRLYTGLIHYPVYNKNSQKITSAITNVDLHDLSRLSRTYGVDRFFVVTPMEEQQRFAQRIMQHWVVGFGATYNSFRKEAIELISIKSSVDDSLEEIRRLEGCDPLIISTSAAQCEDKGLSYEAARDIIDSDKPVFLMFGTAWGLHDEVLELSDYILEPVKGCTDYNHLSVRAAAGIILDRLTGSCR